MLRRMIKIGVTACVVALVVGGLSIAQQAGGGGGGGQGGGRRGGGMRGDPAQFRQMMGDQLKQRLGADDQAWKVMEPRVMKVFDLNRQTSAGGGGRGMFGMMGGRRGGQGGAGGAADAGGQAPPVRGSGPQGEQTALDKAMAQLQTTLENQSASPDEIKKALTGVRETKMKAQQELAVAQEDLKKIVTVRQEAVLVTIGLLN